MRLCPRCKSKLIEVPEAGRYLCGNCNYLSDRVDAPENKGADTPDDAARERFADMPHILALPVYEYFIEENPYIKLHRLANAAEMYCRFSAILFLCALLRQRNGFPEEVRNILRDEIEQPSFGSWKELLDKSMNQRESKDVLVRELPEFSRKLLSYIGAGADDPHQHCLPMRNLIAHSGRVSDTVCKELLQAHKPQFEKIIEDSMFFLRYTLVGVGRGGEAKRLSGIPDARGFPAYKLDAPHAPNRVILIRNEDKASLDVFPLSAYSEIFLWDEKGVRPQGKESPMLYFRRGKKEYIEYTTFVERPNHSQDVGDAFKKFQEVFKVEEWSRLALDKDTLARFTFPGITKPLLDDFVTGTRVQEIAALKSWIKGEKDNSKGVLWLSGKPGMGKSAFMAKVASDLRGSKNNILIPFYFRISNQDISNRMCFMQAAILTLNSASQRAEEPEADPVKREIQFFRILEETARQLQTGNPRTDRKIIFFLDGMDEIHSLDKTFCKLVFERRFPSVLWVCAGRDNKELEGLFSRERCHWLFPDGGALPPLTPNEVRAILTDKCGKAIDAFFRRDYQGKDGAYKNPYLDTLVERCGGLPLYLEYLTEDIREGRHDFSRENELPKGLTEYYEKIMDRMGIADVKSVMTPLICVLAKSREPLTYGQLTEIMSPMLNLLPEWESLIQKTLEHGHVMLKRQTSGTGALGYALYHDSFRVHLDASEQVKQYMAGAHNALTRFCLRWKDFSADKECLHYSLRHAANHLIAAESWGKLEALLTDLEFIEAKCRVGMTYELVKDYNIAIGEILKHLSQGTTVSVQSHRLKQCLVIAKAFAYCIDSISIDLESVISQLYFVVGSIYPDDLSEIKECFDNYLNSKNQFYLRYQHHFSHNQIPTVASYTHTNGFIQFAMFSPDAQIVLFVDGTGTVSSWNWKSGIFESCQCPTNVHVISRYARIVDESMLLVGTEKELWLFSMDSIWSGDVSKAEWKLLHAVNDKSKLSAIAVSEVGQYAFIAKSGGNNDVLLFFDIHAMQITQQCHLPSMQLGMHVNSIAISSDDKWRAICFGDGNLILSTGLAFKAHDVSAYQCQFIGDFLVTCGGDETFAVWDMLRGEIYRSVPEFGAIECFAYSSKHHIIALSHRSGYISLYSMDGDIPKRYNATGFWPGIDGWATSITFSLCGRYLLIGSREKGLRIIDFNRLIAPETINKELFQDSQIDKVDCAEIVDSLSITIFKSKKKALYSSSLRVDSRYLPVQCTCFCVDRFRHLLIVDGFNSIMFLNPETGEPVTTYRHEETFSPISMALSSCGKLLCLIEERNIRIFDVSVLDSGCREIKRISLQSFISEAPEPIRTLRYALPITFCSNDEFIAFALEPFMVASGTINNHSIVMDGFDTPHNTVWVINAFSGEVVGAVRYEGWCTALCSDNTSDLIAIGLGHITIEISAKSVDGGKETKKFFGSSHSPKPKIILHSVRAQKDIVMDAPSPFIGITSLAFGPRDRLLAVGFNDGRIRLAAPQKGIWQWVASVSLVEGAVLALKFDDKGDLFAADTGSVCGNVPRLFNFSITGL